MSPAQRKLLRRNFAPPGAVKRATVFVVVCTVLAYAPAIAQALGASA